MSNCIMYYLSHCVRSLFIECGPTVVQVAEERFANMRTVRAFVQEKNESLVYNSRIDNVLQLSYREAVARAFFWAMVTCHCFLHHT